MEDENGKRTVTVETPTENALIAQDGIGGYDWSYQAEEEHPTNFALMAHTYSESSSSSDSEIDSCSKSCLESVEARLAHYKKNEAVFEESINVLKLEVKLRDTTLVENKKKLEKVEKERDELKLTLEKFQNSSKSLNNLLKSQVINKFKSGLGYNAASSTAVESFVNSSEMLENQENNKSRSDKGPDLTFMDEIVESENIDVITVVTPSNVKNVESNHEFADVRNNGDAVEPKTVRMNTFRPPVIEDWNSNDDSEVEFIPNVENKSVKPSTKKIKLANSARETPKKTNSIPQAVLTKSGKINTAGASVNTAGSKPTMNHPRPISKSYKKGYSQGNPQQKEYKEKGVIDSGCSRHMTGNKCYLTKYEDYDGRFVSFGD
ncbi:hypothetical protein Tco_1280863, partial [Tanacetum coccineum]